MIQDRHIRTAILLTVVFIASLCGCKTAKDAGRQPTTVEPTGEIVPASEYIRPEIRVGSLIESYRSWQDVSMPVKCRLRYPTSAGISGRATMIRDKEIYVSLRMLGMEVAGVYADSDSIFIYEKLNRTMLAVPVAKITKSSGLTLSDIQDLLLGRICYPGHGQIETSTLDLFSIEEMADASILLTPRRKPKIKASWSYTLAGSPMPSLVSADVVVEKKDSATCSYAPAMQTLSGPACPSMSINIRGERQKVDASLEWSLGRAEWNKNRTPARHVPKGYKRLPLDNLLKDFSTF